MHFTHSMPSGGDSPDASERRGYARHAPNSLAYVHLDETNGGILINLSEGGLSVQAAMSVMEDDLPRVRLQMPLSTTWLEASARVVWTSDSRRTLGIQFVSLVESDREQLREWLATETKAPADSAGIASPPSESRIDVPLEHEIPMKAIRSARPRIHSAEPKEFDLAALLASKETAAAAALASIQRVPEPPSPALHTVPKSATVPEHVEKKTPSSQGGYALLVVILAVLSLAAGWEAGRGNMLQTVEALFLPSSVAPRSLVASGAASRSTPNGAAANFEVVDANNQAWLVPFVGPASAAAGGPSLPSVPARNLAAQDQTSPDSSHSYQLWTLAAPQSSHSRSVQTAAAPVLPSSQSSPLPGALGPTDPNFNLVPPAQEPERSSTLIPPEVSHRVDPVYPTEAYQQRISGTVKLEARITESGAVTNVKSLSGPPILVPAAMTALRQWRYKPEMLDGHAVASDIVVTIEFDLPR
ncbi:MAG TPA: TonB family protein [Candidatus Aquilonibacter sp.]|nr:TonB family protein [Candidatus Aquilonibacter sp.]